MTSLAWRTEATHKKLMAAMEASLGRMISCLGKTEATNFEADPKEMEFCANYQEIPEDDAAVETSRVPNKRHKGRSVAAGHRSQPEERIQGNCGFSQEIGRRPQEDDPRTGLSRRNGHIVSWSEKRNNVKRTDFREEAPAETEK
jgi:hypothetical protein